MNHFKFNGQLKLHLLEKNLNRTYDIAKVLNVTCFIIYNNFLTRHCAYHLNQCVAWNHSKYPNNILEDTIVFIMACIFVQNRAYKCNYFHLNIH